MGDPFNSLAHHDLALVDGPQVYTTGIECVLLCDVGKGCVPISLKEGGEWFRLYRLPNGQWSLVRVAELVAWALRLDAKDCEGGGMVDVSQQQIEAAANLVVLPYDQRVEMIEAARSAGGLFSPVLMWYPRTFRAGHARRAAASAHASGTFGLWHWWGEYWCDGPFKAVLDMAPQRRTAPEPAALCDTR